MVFGWDSFRNGKNPERAGHPGVGTYIKKSEKASPAAGAITFHRHWLLENFKGFATGTSSSSSVGSFGFGSILTWLWLLVSLLLPAGIHEVRLFRIVCGGTAARIESPLFRFGMPFGEPFFGKLLLRESIFNLAFTLWRRVSCLQSSRKRFHYVL